jgi:hypothetical protein
LILKYEEQSIGIVRNPYERLVSMYFGSLNYIGFDKWIEQNKPEKQVILFKDCDILVRFEAWEEELKFHNLHPKDTSILDDEQITPMWDRWYTIKSKTLVYGLYYEDIETYGYSF